MSSLFEDAVKLISAGALEMKSRYGWEFLYCPSNLLTSSLFWFIAINPGAVEGQTHATTVESFEAGNAYYVDKPWSPDGERLRSQVKSFFDTLANNIGSGESTGKDL